MRARSGAGVHNLNEVAANELMPTPSTSNRDGNQHNNRGEPLLPGAAESVRVVFDTPDTMPDRPNSGSNRRSQIAGLGNQVAEVEYFPTPTAGLGSSGQKSRSGDRRGEELLGGIVSHMLPTPLGSDGVHGGPNQRGGSGDLRLSSVEALFPTPVVTDSEEARNSTAGRSPMSAGRAAAHSGDTLLDAMTKIGAADPGSELLPTPTTEPNTGNGHARDLSGELLPMLPTPTTQDGANDGGPSQFERNTPPLNAEVMLLPTPDAGGANDGEDAAQWRARHDHHASKPNATRSGTPLPVAVQEADSGEIADLTADGDRVRWGKYRAAILRATATTGILPPSPTLADGKGGKRRLAARFVEWMMMLLPGWVTGVPGVSRRDALKALGNGVVPDQAEIATVILLDRVRARLGAA